jgi:hypothetical protein
MISPVVWCQPGALHCVQAAAPGRALWARSSNRAARKERIPAASEPRHQYIHAVDVVPTIYDLLGIEPPEVMKGHRQTPIEGESFAAALTDAAAPGKRTQFYTMLGQRSIYHYGWLASTVHPPLSSWGNFDHDEWELYHLDTDRSQSANVAANEPDRLASLKDLWFYYAGIYNGLPLDDRSALEQVLAERPRGAPDRDRYVFYPNCADVPESAGPSITGRSYTIAAGVQVDLADAQGVIWAAGEFPAATACTSRTTGSATPSTGSAPPSKTSSPART